MMGYPEMFRALQYVFLLQQWLILYPIAVIVG